MPVTSHLVSGKVYDLYSVALEGATVTLTHSSISPSLSATTNGVGEYVINLSGLNSQWTAGQSFTITASKTAEGTISSTNIISGAGGQTINLTLAETSDFNYAANVFNKHNLNFVLLTHYDGAKVTRERGLPVYTVSERQYTRALAKKSGTQQVEYQGWANPGSKKTDAVWRIQKFIYDGTFIIDIIWASGNQNFEHKWSNRTSLSYS